MVKVIRKSDASLYARLRSAFKVLNGTKLRVGWLESSQYEDGTSVAYVATIHEFGAPKQNIPARAFMRPTIDREQNNWTELVEQEARKILAGNQDAEGLLNTLGLVVSGEIARSISEVSEPALAEETIRRKGSSKPLVETGLLLDTVTYVIEGQE